VLFLLQWKSKLVYGSAVGMDIHGPDFSEMVKKLVNNAEFGFAGDFGCFDGTLMPDLMWRAGEIVKAWYRHYLPVFDPSVTNAYLDEYMVKIDVLMEECIHATELASNVMFSSIQGNKSGNPWTAIVNTMVESMYNMCVWREIFRSKGREEPELLKYLPLSEFDRFVVFFAYGDDNILSVGDEVIPYYNAVNFAKCMGYHGIEYTNETKTGEIIPHRPVLECSFLKNSIRKDENFVGLYHPLMERSVIEHLTNWVRKGEDPAALLYDNLSNALEFSFHYGKRYYLEFKSRVNKILRKKGMPVLTDQYEDLYVNWLGKFGINI